jgi:hypothetical protein
VKTSRGSCVIIPIKRRSLKMDDLLRVTETKWAGCRHVGEMARMPSILLGEGQFLASRRSSPDFGQWPD